MQAASGTASSLHFPPPTHATSNYHTGPLYSTGELSRLEHVPEHDRVRMRAGPLPLTEYVGSRATTLELYDASKYSYSQQDDRLDPL